MAATLPRTLGELQLYRILQRANLLCYYDAFIQQGGDDVQQLCEAGEDEFLEIMALVGMASKPLHVRRLQKALRDWVTNPALFNQPLTSLPVCSIPVYKLPEGSPTLLPGNGARGETHVKVLISCFSCSCEQSIITLFSAFAQPFLVQVKVHIHYYIGSQSRQVFLHRNFVSNLASQLGTNCIPESSHTYLKAHQVVKPI